MKPGLLGVVSWGYVIPGPFLSSLCFFLVQPPWNWQLPYLPNKTGVDTSTIVPSSLLQRTVLSENLSHGRPFSPKLLPLGISSQLQGKQLLPSPGNQILTLFYPGACQEWLIFSWSPWWEDRRVDQTCNDGLHWIKLQSNRPPQPMNQSARAKLLVGYSLKLASLVVEQSWGGQRVYLEGCIGSQESLSLSIFPSVSGPEMQPRAVLECRVPDDTFS